MSSYIKATNFFTKDALLSGDPFKIIKGAELDDEFNSIAIASNSKADTNSPLLTGIPTTPTASAGTSTNQIASTAFVLTNGVPQGAILLWSGIVAAIPVGFNLCDGTNGTPDLRNRFILGAGSTYAPNVSGGSNDATVPSHTHAAVVTDPGHAHPYLKVGYNGNRIVDGLDAASLYYDLNFAATTTSAATGISVTNTATGVSPTNANMPAYLALAYIMKL
jgi:hypothetical protein